LVTYNMQLRLSITAIIITFILLSYISLRNPNTHDNMKRTIESTSPNPTSSNPTSSNSTSSPFVPMSMPSINTTSNSTNSNSTNPVISLQRQSELESQGTEEERLNLLQTSDFVFDFLNPPSGVSKGEGGSTVAATASNFAALIDHGIAMTVGFIEPCGINLPHFHPRATEINFIVEGVFQAGFFSENEGKFVGNTLSPGMVTVFPMGVIHFEVNTNCQRGIFVAAFNNQDPGVTTIANAFFGGLPAEIVGASLGNLGIQNVTDLLNRLPLNPGVVEECRIRCGLN